MAGAADKPGFGGVYLGPATELIAQNPAGGGAPARVASIKRSALGRSSSKKKKDDAGGSGGGGGGGAETTAQGPVWGGVYVGPTTSAVTTTVKPAESSSTDRKDAGRRSSRSKSPKAGALSVGALTDQCSLLSLSLSHTALDLFVNSSIRFFFFS